jgi:diaminopimelate decarboxylase
VKVAAVRELIGDRVRISDEPGRSLVGRSGVTLYSVETVKRNVSTWVAVDGGMADNLRPMLYGARYEVQVVDRFAGGPGATAAEPTACRVVGKHCESSDVLVPDALLDDPRPGDVLVTPVTGAYGYAMSNTYNGVPRPPVVFASGGRSRVVVRRERIDELWSRDV